MSRHVRLQKRSTFVPDQPVHAAGGADGRRRGPRTQGNAVTAGLLGLFSAFARQEAERSRAPDGARAPVDPTPLRQALAAYSAASFRIGAPRWARAASRMGDLTHPAAGHSPAASHVRAVWSGSRLRPPPCCSRLPLHVELRGSAPLRGA